MNNNDNFENSQQNNSENVKNEPVNSENAKGALPNNPDGSQETGQSPIHNYGRQPVNQPPAGTFVENQATSSYIDSTTQSYQPYTSQQPATPAPAETGSTSAGQSEYNFDYNSYENYNQAPKEKKNKGLIAFLAILLGSLIVGLIGISLFSVNMDSPIISGGETESVSEESQQAAVEIPRKTEPRRNYSTGELLTTPEVASKVIPSVVGILKYENSLYEPAGLGSGFIVSEKDGYYYIVTNNHVTAQGTSFMVRLDDSREFEATLVGADEASDLAVLRIQAEGLIVADIGNSDDLLVGETVVAIGNPLDLEFSSSVTQGIVSAMNRNLSMGNILNYIQTDAAINPGNSGGALVNMYGEIIGINTVKVQGTGLEGMGFALPINEAIPIVEELIEVGKVASRPVLGIQGVEVTEMLAYELNIPMGLMVKDVSESANFQPELVLDDIITHVDGERITGLPDLRSILATHSIGDTLELTIYRTDPTTQRSEDNIKVKATLITAE